MRLLGLQEAQDQFLRLTGGMESVFLSFLETQIRPFMREGDMQSDLQDF